MSFIKASAADRYPTTLFPDMNPLDSTGMTSMPYRAEAALLTAMISSPIIPETQVAYTKMAGGWYFSTISAMAAISFFSPPKTTSCSFMSVEKLFRYISDPLDRLPRISHV